ncbi:FAD-binding oxidoreductase [Fodinicola acaciae]|uniref:FAD-binding oxidoreductase n=1 Tax=Fodinicola acaciae TaxID=2681555 RepID=UPI0013D86EE7|nr:FAD-linked oxidase C-terminal domain-containing protein [Fodinicola acaciae]
MTTIPAAAVGELRERLGGAVVLDEDVRSAYAHDEADLVEHGMPACVVHARSTNDVVNTLKTAAKYGIPVVPQGALTGLAGAANAIDGCVALSLRKMDEIIEIDPVNRLAVVRPGVVNKTLTEAVGRHGLRYPPDPGSWESSTIGGNVATNAGGMCCVKYGVTAEYVLGLEVVLADGEVLRTGRRTAKGVAGYDLTRLFVGSEGTLGVITEITLALRPASEGALSLAAVFGDTVSAGAAVSAIVADGRTPSLLEIMDQTLIRAIEDYRPMDLPTDAAALLLAAVDDGSSAQLERIAELCTAAGATEVHVASDPVEGEMLLEARRLAHPAMERLGHFIVDDIAVPRSALAELIDGAQRIGEKHQVKVAMVGHAGDGNMHPNLIVDRDDPDSHRRCMAAFDAIMRLGLDLGGTCTGEHGVGMLKKGWLATEIGPVGLRTHRAVKAAFDPAGILNPGKVFDATA